MAGDVSNSARPARKESVSRRRKRRLSVRIDMTPMVDIAFLLLIFYMVTTIFALPKAMEITLPPDNIVPVRNLLTIRVDDDNRFYWNLGHKLPTPMRADSLYILLLDQNRETPKLNTRLIIHPRARYRVMVDILDEIEAVERKFNNAIAAELGVTPEEFTDPGSSRYVECSRRRFSYRYALSPWEDRDKRIIEKVLQERKEGMP